MHRDHKRDITNFDMAHAIHQQYAPIDPRLDNMFVPSTPKNTYDKPAPHYDFREHQPSGYDTFKSDAMPYDAYHTGCQGPMTPDSAADHLGPNDDQFHGAFEEPNGHATNNQREEETEYPSEFWPTLVDFEIPGFMETSLNDIPGFQALLAVYLSHYSTQSTATNATRMQYAKALVFAWLTHYHPASQGYTVAPTSPGPIAKYGMNFILAADDKSDIWKGTRRKKKKKKKKANSTNKANRRRAPTKRELERAEKAKKVAKEAEYNHGFAYMANLQWDYVPPQDIAAFAVMCETEVRDGNTGMITYKQHLHTYLAIMIDNFAKLPRFSTENTVHRSDVLTDALCRSGKIQHGHGMLLYGPRLECYTFDRGSEWTCSDSDDDDGDDDAERGQEPRDMEPKMEVLQSGGQDMEFDLRTTDLNTVDAALKEIAVREVVYMTEPETVAFEDAGSADGDKVMEKQQVHCGGLEGETCI